MEFTEKALNKEQKDSLRKCTSAYLSLPTGWDKYTFLYLRNLRETKKRADPKNRENRTMNQKLH